MTRLRRRAPTALVAVLAWVVACGRGASSPAALPCDMGPPFQPVVTPVAGYPIPRPKLTEDELARRKAQLEARVRGWTVVLHASGAIASVLSDPVGELQDYIDGARVEKALALVRALADELDLVGTIEAAPHIRDVVFSIGGKPLDLYVQQTTPGPPQPYRLLLVVPELPPKLPANVHVRTPEEIVAAFGPAWPRAKVRVSTAYDAMPCDLVHGPGDCATTAGGTAQSCESVTSFRFVTGAVQTEGRYRYVVGLRECLSAQCEASFPTCIDAVTGEPLVRECTYLPR